MTEFLRGTMDLIKALPDPCPFCGCKHIDIEGHGQVAVVCHNCKAEGPLSIGPRFAYTPEEAIADAVMKWNTRWAALPETGNK